MLVTFYSPAFLTCCAGEMCFTRGVAGIDAHNLLAVGTSPCLQQTTSSFFSLSIFVSLSGISTGGILLFDVNDDSFCFRELLRRHSHPITSMAAYGSYLASADDGGNVVVWQADGREVSVDCVFKGSG